MYRVVLAEDVMYVRYTPSVILDDTSIYEWNP